MRVTLESTTKIVTLQVHGVDVPARVWEGTTEEGVACHAYITRIAVNKHDDASQFERELQEQRAPRNPDIAASPARLVL